MQKKNGINWTPGYQNMAKTVNKHRAENYPVDMSGLGPDMSSLSWIYIEKGDICLVHPETFFSTLILEL
jgi:hypothetical protein